jgi:hypothetical protein
MDSPQPVLPSAAPSTQLSLVAADAGKGGAGGAAAGAEPASPNLPLQLHALDLNKVPRHWPASNVPTTLLPAGAASSVLTGPYPMIKDIKSDFISDNQLLRNLLSWQMSDRPVAVIVHKIGPTLVLEDGAQMCADSPCMHAVMVSSIAIDGTWSSSRPLPPITPQPTKKNPLAQRHRQLLSKLQVRAPRPPAAPLTRASQSQILPHNALSAESKVHEWRHKDHSVVVASDVPVYRINSQPSALHLMDADRPVQQSTVARLFLDNVMVRRSLGGWGLGLTRRPQPQAGIPVLTLAKHREGLLDGTLMQLATHEIPSLAASLSVAEIERNATALLSFLKQNCVQDLSSFLFFKPRGAQVAGWVGRPLALLLLLAVDAAADAALQTVEDRPRQGLDD